jgi:hypothetical protein
MNGAVGGAASDRDLRCVLGSGENWLRGVTGDGSDGEEKDVSVEVDGEVVAIAAVVVGTADAGESMLVEKVPEES